MRCVGGTALLSLWCTKKERRRMVLRGAIIQQRERTWPEPHRSMYNKVADSVASEKGVGTGMVRKKQRFCVNPS